MNIYQLVRMMKTILTFEIELTHSVYLITFTPVIHNEILCWILILHYDMSE